MNAVEFGVSLQTRPNGPLCFQLPVHLVPLESLDATSIHFPDRDTQFLPLEALMIQESATGHRREA